MSGANGQEGAIPARSFEPEKGKRKTGVLAGSLNAGDTGKRTEEERTKAVAV